MPEYEEQGVMPGFAPLNPNCERYIVNFRPENGNIVMIV